jgi:hypothetical protein
MTKRAVHEASCLIMAALAGDSQHGAQIMARVRDMSGGRFQLRAGTLFTVLDTLRAYDMVSIDRSEIVGGRPRRYYRLTPASSGPPAEAAALAARPDLRIGDADRDAAAAALGEHFAHGRLTIAELHARLDAALAAVTQRDISRAIQDLPRQLAWPEGGGGDGDLDLPARQAAQAP